MVTFLISGRFSVGQNKGKGYTNWPDVIKAWAAEKKDFTYNGKNDLNKVGHYTQVKDIELLLIDLLTQISLEQSW